MVSWRDSGLCGCNIYVVCCFTVLKSPKVRSGTNPDRQDAAVRVIRGVDIPRIMFWHAAGSSNGCLQFPQW
eukprot:7286353-Pyramimonas_sp.AAC.1